PPARFRAARVEGRWREIGSARPDRGQGRHGGVAPGCWRRRGANPGGAAMRLVAQAAQGVAHPPADLDARPAAQSVEEAMELERDDQPAVQAALEGAGQDLADDLERGPQLRL